MKIVLILVICLIICLIGITLGNQYVVKAKFYASLLTLLEDIKLNISFKKDNIESILNSHNDNPNLKQFLASFRTYLTSHRLDLNKVSAIDDEDRLDITSIVENLGRYNAETELIQLDSFIGRIRLKANKADSDRKKFAPMMIKLSILLSLAVGVILI